MGRWLTKITEDIHASPGRVLGLSPTGTPRGCLPDYRPGSTSCLFYSQGTLASTKETHAGWEFQRRRRDRLDPGTGAARLCVPKPWWGPPGYHKTIPSPQSRAGILSPCMLDVWGWITLVRVALCFAGCLEQPRLRTPPPAR